ncbi:hypothetical protein SASPL_114104 [Salvia splendens]|uniref:GUN4-like domain-containing protein n=1 Tax=Salvia splendens TaxID=180675 RepID=A0A8X9A0W0_SALSN|nr:hypothetical protein SASPL_114104 [Salvia splendens]
MVRFEVFVAKGRKLFGVRSISKEIHIKGGDEETCRLINALAGDAAVKRGYVFFSEVQFILAEALQEIDAQWPQHNDWKFGGVDEEAGELGGGAVQLQGLSGGVYVGDGGGAAGEASAADECAERDATAQLHSQPPDF